MLKHETLWLPFLPSKAPKKAVHAPAGLVCIIVRILVHTISALAEEDTVVATWSTRAWSVSNIESHGCLERPRPLKPRVDSLQGTVESEPARLFAQRYDGDLRQVRSATPSMPHDNLL